jgi:ClpP class serine protease
MDFTLAKEIYGTAWSVDAVSFMHLTSILKNIQNGLVLDVPEQKLNSIGVLEIKSDSRIVKSNYDLNNKDSFDGIGIINLNGAITKSGGASTDGTKQMSETMLQMASDNRVKGFVVLTDSGGGATGAVQIMIDAINEVKKTKPVYALIEKGGMAGSAAYGIISACTEIYSEDDMNIVGSVGTMIQFSGKPNGNVDRDGEKTVVLYATKSTAKNKAFEEAINNDNYDLIINELLDPINENFISNVLSNRPKLKGSKFDDGHTVFSKDAIGTFIDGIASFDEVVSMILNDSKDLQNKLIINSNSKIMNKSEFKSQFPDAYQEIVSEGVKLEQERVGSWMAYSEADPKAVSEGIASGLAISQSQSHGFLVKMAQKGKLADLQSDNAPAIVTNGTPTELNEKSEHDKEIESAFNFKL